MVQSSDDVDDDNNDNDGQFIIVLALRHFVRNKPKIYD